MEKKRILYFDFLRVIGAIAVIFIHVVSEYWYGLDLGGNDFKILTLIDSVCRFCVPVYLMVSGALFLDENRTLDLKYLFKHYILRMFLIFVFWNLTYCILDTVIMRHEIMTLPLLGSILVNTLLGKGVFHLRFLTIIIGFYLSVPILRLITKKTNKKQLEYLIVLLFIFTSINLISAKLWNISLNYLSNFSGYLLYFILGYYLHNFDLSEKLKKSVYVLGLISLGLTYFLTVKYSHLLNYPCEYFFNYLAPNVVIYTGSIFLVSKNTIKTDKHHLIYKLGRVYFGVYLIHGLVLGTCVKLGLFGLPLPLGFLVLLLTVIIFSVSLVSSYIVSKIPYVNKLILYK